MSWVTYSVRSAVLLLRAEDATRTLGSVQGSLASNDGLPLSLARSTDLAANLGDIIPIVRHLVGLKGR